MPAKATLRRPVSLPDYLPARMLNEFVYCPRLFFYEWVEGVFAHSADTVEGALRHEKLGEKADAMPAADEAGTERIHSRSVTLTSDAHHLIASIDLVEGDGQSVAPVDYKHGAPRDRDGALEAWPADRAQVCVQALVLRDNGYHCDEAVVYYNATKQRVRVPIDEALVSEALDALGRARAVAAAGLIPAPLSDSPKCPRCSLVSICLPDETRAALAWREPEADTGGQLGLFESAASAPADAVEDEIRRLVPARDDLRPLYVTGYNFLIGKSNDVLQVREKRELVQEVRIREISQVSVFGNVSLTAGAIQALCDAERPVAHFSFGGWFHGLTQGLGLKNVFLRQEQFRRADDEAFCLRVAREIVASKIRNQRTLLQRNHVEPPARAVDALKRLARQALDAGQLDTLLGLEGTAAHYYFANLAGMLKVDDEADRPQFDFTRRNRRPPRDPVNALLSFGYSMLARDLTITCHAIGFDPFMGFYHQPRFGRPALALDLMEGFRPLIVDSAVITAVNTRMVTPDDFIQVGPSVALTPKGRKRFITAYEQRMDALVTHPLFGYRVNYRRVLEIQARLLARVVTGELPSYPGFETR
ncbi:MAG: CRISPR-associated endonuclease Cas4/Cas1 [Acidobacteria bacterium RIFCSPLOWO2_12_FULL_67_14]|nr:MAG: CRISPR-associated endonuclease Cas4/Cas1 [Acidobacteria bacterium RIFCSPLOWO2_02_FULL_67_21]OFW36122.1 MAG: CRISPR-associated endonuclease Cas4/Cas1 [Acidobacteria bacterium RIFCSPLOWO2_12_FULL_67_14]